MHFDKINDCVQYPLKNIPHYCRRHFIAFYVVNFILLTNTNLDLLYKVDAHIFRQMYLYCPYHCVQDRLKRNQNEIQSICCMHARTRRVIVFYVGREFVKGDNKSSV